MELDGFVEVGALLRSGVYALVYKGVVVYIGKSKMMLSRVYSHKAQWARSRKNPRGGAIPWLPKGVAFDDIWVRPCPINELDALEYDMINRYKPTHNKMLKNGLPVDIKHLVTQLVSAKAFAEVPIKPEGTIRRRV